MNRSVALAGLASALCVSAPSLHAGSQRLPNIVIIVPDDMGYADIGSFGSQWNETPNIDQLARQGRIFTDFYVPRSLCTASRAALLTGCYPLRIGIPGAFTYKVSTGLNAGEMTLAELVKQRGYATACYGKWHLGHHPKFLPANHGFDRFFGLPYSHNMWPFNPRIGDRCPDLRLLEGTRVVDPQVTGGDLEQLTAELTERSVRFIEEKKDRPFLLCLWYIMPHVPLYVSDNFRGKSRRGLYGDVLMELDWSVGQVLDALRKNGLQEDTLVIFFSDNGPGLSFGTHGGSAGPLRGGKRTTFEGGCRVPAIMWWPGKIPAGTTCRVPAMTIDIFPTIANLVGATLPERKVDGKDMWPLIAGEPGAKSPNDAYFFYVRRRLQAVRMGKWKLHFPHRYPTLGGHPGGKGGLPKSYDTAEIGLALFDLETDIGETTNVADQHPEVVAEIQKLANEMRADLGDAASFQGGRGWRPPGRLNDSDLRFDWQPRKRSAAISGIMAALHRPSFTALLYAAPVVAVLLALSFKLARSGRERLVNAAAGVVGIAVAASALLSLGLPQQSRFFDNYFAVFFAAARVAGAAAALAACVFVRARVAGRSRSRAPTPHTARGAKSLARKLQKQNSTPELP